MEKEVEKNGNRNSHIHVTKRPYRIFSKPNSSVPSII